MNIQSTPQLGVNILHQYFQFRLTSDFSNITLGWENILGLQFARVVFLHAGCLPVA